MAKFAYKAKKGAKDIVEGRMEADNEKIVVSRLSQMGMYPIKIDAENNSVSIVRRLPFSGRVGTKDMAVFTHQFSDLLGSGLTLMSALGILREQMENKVLKTVLEDVEAKVRDGVPLSEAFAAHPKVFSGFFVSMVNSGEVGGVLEDVLKRLSAYYEKEDDIKSKIQSAMAYPCLVLAVGIGTVFVLLSFVIPKLTAIFDEFGQALPFPTRLMIGISDYFARFWWLILCILVATILVVTRVASSRQGKYRIDLFILSVPLFGIFIKKTELSRMTKSLSVLLENGVPILRSIEVVSATSANEVLRREFEMIGSKIKDGASFSSAIKDNAQFPVFIKNMISVGEESGNLEGALNRIGDSYEHDADRAVKIMTSLIEPLMILAMGAVVAFIVVAMLLPIFQLNLMVK